MYGCCVNLLHKKINKVSQNTLQYMKPMKYWQPFFIFSLFMEFHFTYKTSPIRLQNQTRYPLQSAILSKRAFFPFDQCIVFTNAHAQFLCSVSLLKDCSLYWWYLGRGYFSTEKFLYFLKSQNTATSILMHIDPT